MYTQNISKLTLSYLYGMIYIKENGINISAWGIIK